MPDFVPQEAFAPHLTEDGQWMRLRVPAFSPARRCLFLDRDGVMIVERHYLCDPAGVELVPGCLEAIAAARRAGWAVVVVSNQSGIGRGRFGWPEHFAVENRLLELIHAGGETVDALLACPNHPNVSGPYGKDHAWRKPGPGMVLAAAKALHLDLQASLLVGDKASDIEAGRAAGLKRAVHVLTGHGEAERDHATALSTSSFTVMAAPSIAAIPGLLDS